MEVQDDWASCRWLALVLSERYGSVITRPREKCTPRRRLCLTLNSWGVGAGPESGGEFPECGHEIGVVAAGG